VENLGIINLDLIVVVAESGGLVGQLDVTGSITACYTTGRVVSSNVSVTAGGLVGYNNGGSITNSYSTANVSGSSSSSTLNVGGLVGVNTNGGTITNCYSTGNVNGISQYNAYVGGLVGWVPDNLSSITNSFSAGWVTASADTGIHSGGLIGYATTTVSLASSYWDTDASGQSSSVAGTGETNANMRTLSPFSGWNFSTTWAMTAGKNFSYPYLINVTDRALAVQARGFSATANVNSVMLSWSTQSEVNNAGFNVLRQRMSNPEQGTQNYKLIASYQTNKDLAGLGTSTTGRNYSFTDTKVLSGAKYQYEIESVSTDGTIKVVDTVTVSVSEPETYVLFQNFPNPFNPATTIRFDLKQTSTVTLEIYNVLGQRVASWNYGTMDAGRYEKSIAMAQYSSGVYFYRIVAQGNDGEKFASVKKLMLVK